MKKFVFSILLTASASLVFGQGHLDPRNDDWGVGGGGAGCSATFTCGNGGTVSCSATAGGTCNVTSNGVICYEPDGTHTAAGCM